MKILAIFPSFRPSGSNESIGGGEISNRMLLEGLSELGHEVIVLTRNKGNSATHRPPHALNVFEVVNTVKRRPLKNGLSLVLFKSIASDFSKKHKPDIILTATSALPVAITAGKRSNTPVGVFIRAYENFANSPEKPKGLLDNAKHLIKKTLIGNYGPEALIKANFLLTNSRFMDEYCKKALGNINSYVVYPPLDIENRTFESPNALMTVCMVGTSQKKGTGLAFKVAKYFPKTNFRVIGYPGLSAGEEHVVDNITLCGWSNVQKEFQKSDLVLVPSKWQEPFGRVAVEALAAGKVVFVSNKGGLPEAVGYEDSLIVRSCDEIDWVDRIRDFIKNTKTYCNYGKNALSKICAYSPKSQVNTLESSLFLEIERKKELSASR